MRRLALPRAHRAVLIIALLSIVCSGCAVRGITDVGGSRDRQDANAPRLAASTPRSGAALAAGSRRVVLSFDREVDTGAQLVVVRDGSDVTAGTPELSADRRRLEADVDVERDGTYRVEYRVCGARDKRACAKGHTTFTATAGHGLSAAGVRVEGGQRNG